MPELAGGGVAFAGVAPSVGATKLTAFDDAALPGVAAIAASTTRQDGARIELQATELARPTKAGFFMCLSWETDLQQISHHFK